MIELVVCDGVDPPPAATGSIVHEWRDDRAAVFARAFGRDGRYRLEWRGLGTIAFATGSAQVRLWPAPESSRADVLDGFTRIALPVVLQALGAETLHASAVATPAGALAFCGRSGAGKSTLAYALGRQPDTSQLADDAVVIAMDGARPEVLPLAFRPRLRESARAALRAAVAAPMTATDAARQPLAGIFLLEREERAVAPVRVDRLPAHEAFRALLPHAHCFDEGDRRGTARLVEHYLTIVERVPVWRLLYRPDFATLPLVLRAVLEAGSPAPAAAHAGR
jgi:hypothetical protein